MVFLLKYHTYSLKQFSPFAKRIIQCSVNRRRWTSKSILMLKWTFYGNQELPLSLEKCTSVPNKMYERLKCGFVHTEPEQKLRQVNNYKSSEYCSEELQFMRLFKLGVFNFYLSMLSVL